MSDMSGRVGVLLLCVLLPAFAEKNLQNVNDFLFSGGLEFKDLSYPFNNATVYWPGTKRFEFTRKHAETRPDGTWYSSNQFCAEEHGGTHMDAPRHFAKNQWTVGQIPFDHLITPLRIVDMSKVVAGNNDFVLQKHHMDFLFAGDAKRNFTVFFKFGWSEFYGDDEKYFGTRSPSPNNLNFPGISEDVARWITETKNLVGVGVDTPSVDVGSDITYPAHKIFSDKNIFILENLRLVDDMPTSQCAAIIMPMKIQKGTGAPCRVTAICPKIYGQSLF